MILFRSSLFRSFNSHGKAYAYVVEFMTCTCEVHVPYVHTYIHEASHSCTHVGEIKNKSESFKKVQKTSEQNVLCILRGCLSNES